MREFDIPTRLRPHPLPPNSKKFINFFFVDMNIYCD